MAKAGRPTDYTEDLADLICSRIAEGESMRSISRDDSMPAMSTLFLWLRTHEIFSEQYAKAKIESHSALFEEIMDIADDGTNDWMERNAKDNEGYILNGEALQRSRLRVDTRKWALSKIIPKKYGDKIMTEHSGSVGTYESLSPDELNRQIAEKQQAFAQSQED